MFSKKKVVVIGAGASAFDTAAVALEHGADNVVMLVRRSALPVVNKFSKFSFPGMLNGFYSLSDETRCLLFAEAFENGIPPTQEAVDRIKDAKDFCVIYDVHIQGVKQKQDGVLIHSSRGDFSADLVVLGTGYGIDGFKRPELQSFMDAILLWQDHVSPEILKRMPKLGHFPYLAPFSVSREQTGASPVFKKPLLF